MSEKNKIKSEQLGMSFSTANNQLRKMIMFDLVKKCGLDTCFKCGDKIADIKDFSIEHKVAWLHSENSKELFFDTENIAFSHHSCNINNNRLKSIVNNKSGFKGVYFDKSRKNKPYSASYSVGNKNYTIGRYETAEEAGRAYDEKIVEVFGDRAVTNESLGLL